MEDQKLTPDILLAQTFCKALEELMKEATHDGFQKEFGCGVDTLWGFIPTKFKTVFQDKWNALNTKMPDDVKDKGLWKYKKLCDKLQLVIDAIAENGWLFKTRTTNLGDLTKNINVDDYDG